MNRLLRSGKYINFLFLIFFVGIVHFALLNTKCVKAAERKTAHLCCLFYCPMSHLEIKKTKTASALRVSTQAQMRNFF